MKKSGFMLPLYLADPNEPACNNVPTGRCKNSQRYDKNNIEILIGEELPANIIVRKEEANDSPPPNITDSSNNDKKENIIIGTISVKDLLRAHQSQEEIEKVKLSGDNTVDDGSS